MFGALKKKLQEAIGKITGKKEEPAKPVEESLEEKAERKVEKEEEKPEPQPYLEKIEEKIEVKEEEKPPVSALEKAGEPPKEEKPGFLAGLLEKVTKKVTEKTLSDDEIEKFLKDLQLALLENDVALETAERICGDVRKELGGKSVKRSGVEGEIKNALRNAMLGVMQQKEINLEQMIDGNYERTRQPLLIVFFGFNGTGKCVSGDTLVPLPNGNIEEIQKLYEKHSPNEKPVKDGYAIELKEPIELFSVNPKTLKIGKVKASTIWKLKKEKILKVSVDGGLEIKVTPEHPFFVLRSGYIEKIRADCLGTNNYVMIPALLKIASEAISKKIILDTIADRKLFVVSRKITERAYETMEKQFGSLKTAFKKLEVKAGWITFHYGWRRRGAIPSDLVTELCSIDDTFRKFVEKEEFSLKYGKGLPITTPSLDNDFYEWLGMFYAEGHLGKRYAEFTNTDEMLLEAFAKKTLRVFSVKPQIKSDKRNPHVKKVLIANMSLAYFMKKALGIPLKKKSRSMSLPNWIVQAPDNLVASFIRCYWECDGSVEKEHRFLEASTGSHKFAKQISLLLLRFGIIVSIAKKKAKNWTYYRIGIAGKDKIKRFNEFIGFISKEKKRRLNDLISLPEQFERTELVPNQSDTLRKARIMSGLTQASLSSEAGLLQSLLCQYELQEYDVKIPLKTLEKITPSLKPEESGFLRILAESDVRWLRVKNVEEIESEDNWVYDFTVPQYHNFVAENFVVHNTTTIAKIAHRLRKYNPVIAAGDTFRAASIEQIEEHGKKLGMDVVKHRYGADSAAVIFDAMKHAQARGSKVVLADTAGRSHSNVNLMDELKKIVRVNNPDLRVLVLDSITGNDIYDQSLLFENAAGVDAIILTKADVYEKGGAALSATHTIRKPVLFLGVGQEYGDLKEFVPEEIVRNLLE